MMDEALTGLGMPVPDSALARRARELIAEVAAPFLVNHSVRSYAWAVELARHDSAPVRSRQSPTCPRSSTTSAWFRCTTSAAATRSTARSVRSGSWARPGNPRARARVIYDVIALHNLETPAARSRVRGRAALALDRHRRYRLPLHRRSAGDHPGGSLAACPRLDFKREFTRLFVDQASRKPTCPAAEMAAMSA